MGQYGCVDCRYGDSREVNVCVKIVFEVEGVMLARA